MAEEFNVQKRSEIQADQRENISSFLGKEILF